MSDSLRELADRLERLAHPADDGRFSWSRLLGRLTRTARTPKIQAEALTNLVDRIEFGYAAYIQRKQGNRASQDIDAAALILQAENIEPVAEVYAAVLRELRLNIERAERTAFVHGQLPDGHLDRLWRLYQVAYRAMHWVEKPEHRSLLGDLIYPDARCALAPLTTASAYGEPRPIVGVDAIIAAANAETRTIGRQRRLLEAARQQLLDAGAALRLEPAAERARRVLLARRISRLDRLEAAGVAADVDLGYQIREAAARGEGPRLCAALSALEENAFAAGDVELQRLASRAAGELSGGATQRLNGATRAASLRTSEDQIFGSSLRPSIDRAYAAAAEKLARLRAHGPSNPDEKIVFSPVFFDDWERFLTVQPTAQLLAAAVATDGCFQVGGTSSPGRVAGEALRAELVTFPQQEMVMEPLGGVADLASAVIGNPRSVLLDLAAGRLLARRYIAMRPHRSGERRMLNEVRVYVLDGSSSMLGPRARMRDALLLVELATLSARMRDATRSGNRVLYYRYFNDTVAETQRVAGVEDATRAVEDVIGTLRYGGTNIQGALLASFEQIRQAAADDPDLARAQIVLVTDGEAGIEEEAIRRAREDVGAIPVGVSIIALGAQNPELRKLAARQRALGERVFYQFVDDDELQTIVDGDLAGLPMHLPPDMAPAALTDELRSVLSDIDRHLRRIDADLIESAALVAAAVAEVGLPAAKGLDQRSRARLAAIENDRVSLDAAFLRAFPAVLPADPPPVLPADPPADLPLVLPPEADAADSTAAPLLADSSRVAEVVTALTTVAEVVETFGAGAVERQADALELLERLLAEAQVPPWAYAELIKDPPEAVKTALRAVHAAARFRRQA